MIDILVYTFLGCLLTIGAVSAIGAVLRAEARNVENHVQVALGEQAAVWDEPTRVDVEANWSNWMDERPAACRARALWGPNDTEADNEWADILRAVDLTPAELRTRYRAAQQADRMDRIRQDIAVRRFSEQLRDWDGGGAA